VCVLCVWLCACRRLCHTDIVTVVWNKTVIEAIGHAVCVFVCVCVCAMNDVRCMMYNV